jgi:hypothetical protein
MPEHSSPEALVPVVLGLMNGADKEGRIQKDSMGGGQVVLFAPAHAPAWMPAQTIPAERVAYIGLKKEAATFESSESGTQTKIHCTAERVFTVALVSTGKDLPLGFFAKPTDADADFGLLFFYNHGVLAREDVTPLGELLVQRMGLGAEGVAQGLSSQQSHRQAPLGKILVDHHGVDPKLIDEAVELQQRSKMRLGEILLEVGAINQDQLEEALRTQQQLRGKRIGEVLVDMGIVSENHLVDVLSAKFRIPIVDLDANPIPAEAIDAIPPSIIRDYRVLPIALDNQALTLALGDPLAVDGIQAVRMHIQKKVREVLAIPSQLQRHIDRLQTF